MFAVFQNLVFNSGNGDLDRIVKVLIHITGRVQ
jgi:hypothetical protein